MSLFSKGKKLKNSLAALFLPAILLGGVLSHGAEQENTGEQKLNTLGMDLSEQEEMAITQAISYGREISRVAEKVNGLPYRRDAHAKATACLRATFSVNGNIPSHFQHSVLARPGKAYKAWIRFSNGDMTVQPDAKPDARGMAIKLMGLEGEKIASELAGAKTQDFIMTNTPAFFNRNIFDYVEDMYYLSKLQRSRWFISLWPPRIHPKMLYRAKQTISSKINTPLEAQYYSMLPYQLGKTALKFSVRPCAGMSFSEKVNKSDKDYLRNAMRDQLSNNAACFDFLLQEKKAGKDMPLDDASVIWSEKDSPFIPVARINIPPQSFDSKEQNTFCENLSMNPWHGVGLWKPLGSLNKARRLVYFAVSKYRHKQNNTNITEPESWCLNNSENCEPGQYFHTSKPRWPLERYFDSQYHAIDKKQP